MDADKVKALCDAAAELLPEIAAYASATKHTPEDDALVRQLRVAASATSAALMALPPMPMPPPMPPMAPPPKPQGS